MIKKTVLRQWNLCWEPQLMRDVIGRLIEILERGGEAIVCQVVETRGSTPQKAGSMMIVDPDGGQGGTLGGGCVENEVKTKALRQLSSGAAAVHSFVLDHDYGWADGLICGGRMVVIAQPVCGSEPLRYFRSVAKFLEEGQGFTEAVVLDTGSTAGQPVGRRFLFDGEGACEPVCHRGRFPGLAAWVVNPARAAETVGPRWDCVLAELAANPADRCGSRPRRPGGRRPGGAS